MFYKIGTPIFFYIDDYNEWNSDEILFAFAFSQASNLLLFSQSTQ